MIFAPKNLPTNSPCFLLSLDVILMENIIFQQRYCTHNKHQKKRAKTGVPPSFRSDGILKSFVEQGCRKEFSRGKIGKRQNCFLYEKIEHTYYLFNYTKLEGTLNVKVIEIIKIYNFIIHIFFVRRNSRKLLQKYTQKKG